MEGFSCYLSGSRAERSFLQQAENTGISEALCSYHKTFLGAAEKGVLPRPACIVYTNLTCDANLLTFRRLAEMYGVPAFAIDIPMQQTEENVAYVADQLRQMAEFLHTVIAVGLTSTPCRSGCALEKFGECQRARVDRYVPTDLVTPLYSGMTNNILLGTEAVEHYADRLLADLKTAGPARGKRSYWMHTISFWSEAVQRALAFREEAQIVGCELSQACEPDFDLESPPLRQWRTGWCIMPSTAAFCGGSTPVSATPGNAAPTGWSGLTTGAASTPWGPPSWPRRSLTRPGCPC